MAARRGSPGLVGKGSAMRVGDGLAEDVRRAMARGLRPCPVQRDELRWTRRWRSPTASPDCPPSPCAWSEMNRGQDIPNIADAWLVDASRFMVLLISEGESERHEAWRERREPRFQGR